MNKSTLRGCCTSMHVEPSAEMPEGALDAVCEAAAALGKRTNGVGTH